jgi:hypothetical protein
MLMTQCYELPPILVLATDAERLAAKPPELAAAFRASAPASGAVVGAGQAPLRKGRSQVARGAVASAMEVAHLPSRRTAQTFSFQVLIKSS